MKALKFTLIATLFLATLASCTKQDLGEDELLRADGNDSEYFTGGSAQD